MLRPKNLPKCIFKKLIRLPCVFDRTVFFQVNIKCIYLYMYKHQHIKVKYILLLYHIIHNSQYRWWDVIWREADAAEGILVLNGTFGAPGSPSSRCAKGIITVGTHRNQIVENRFWKRCLVSKKRWENGEKYRHVVPKCASKRHKMDDSILGTSREMIPLWLKAVDGVVS